MNRQTTQQSGVASSTPNRLVRWLQSKIMTKIASPAAQERLWQREEEKRQAEGRAHTVDYFHQAQDGYSDLAAQTLEKLIARYDIQLRVHLVTAEVGANAPEPDLLQEMSQRDAALVAPYYGLDVPEPLSDVDMMALQDRHSTPATGSRRDREKAGNALRAKLGHYSGAMFYYAGEWYWGVDRLYHLEARLKSLGADKHPTDPPLYPRPAITTTCANTADALTLEYYPSLRSPYTAVSWDATLALAADTDIRLCIKPVLPMVMRGVPATRQKGMYIFKDAAREARAIGTAYGTFYDPIGDPVKKGYSLWWWAEKQGKGTAVLDAFLKCAFTKGVNTNTRAGMKQVATMAGLDWDAAKTHLDHDDWYTDLERNRRDMYAFGSWGVPSYRLLDSTGKPVLGVWGQDRLWLVAKKIEELTAKYEDENGGTNDHKT